MAIQRGAEMYLETIPQTENKIGVARAVMVCQREMGYSKPTGKPSR